MTKYSRLSVHEDGETLPHSSPSGSTWWQKAQRRDRVKRLLMVAAPLLTLAGLSFMFYSPELPLSKPAAANAPTSSDQGSEMLPAPPIELSEPAVNSGWLPFDASASSPHLRRLTANQVPRTEQERVFTAPCTDAWISKSELCPHLTSPSHPLTDIEKLSIVHTWQNGSDAKQSAARAAAEGDHSHGKAGTAIKHFRSHNELRYSLRSVLNAFKDQPEALTSFHIYSSDIPSESDPYTTREGSVPTWLDLENDHFETYNGTEVSIHMAFPWEVFKTSQFQHPHDAYTWREAALPTFNSMSVESQFSNVDTTSDTFAYLCDDMFFMKPLTPADISSPLFGPNFRLVTQGWTNPATRKGNFKGNKEIESESLHWSSWLIQERFGAKGEYLYLQHVSKVFRRSILRELESMWAEELADAGMVRFRGRGTDVNMHSLFIYFTIERHREALLWSAIVAKCDQNQDGIVTPDELKEFIAPLGQIDGDSIAVPYPVRDIKTDDLLREAGLSPTKESFAEFSSANGYAFVWPEPQKVGHNDHWAHYDHAPQEHFCHMPLSCFGDRDNDQLSSDLFKRIAFEDVHCGDCLIPALLGQSGLQGLNAFLPSEEQEEVQLSYETTHERGQNADTVTVLPLKKSWREIDFSLDAVKPPSETPRQFAARLLLRYQYVMGEANHRLIMLVNLEGSTKDLNDISAPAKDSDPALLGINDDIEVDHEEISAKLNEWFASQWPEPAGWEADHRRVR